MTSWGEMLRTYYGKDTAARDTDFVNNYLGYWTDNGKSCVYSPYRIVDEEKPSSAACCTSSSSDVVMLQVLTITTLRSPVRLMKTH